MTMTDAQKTIVFQSTHPVRGATLVQRLAWSREKISIHAPREGCDLQRRAIDAHRAISIHAPREGCDTVRTSSAGTRSNFNPRTP